ncbi:hypothetical protein V6N11_070333 [Hibiscus sabdariffa]|uniref:Uncharacterized protein n=1 Tax=Hibiscus sabdariffa TaxID=183260 RepID=A0ABR2QEP7_9ROSI
MDRFYPRLPHSQLGLTHIKGLALEIPLLANLSANIPYSGTSKPSDNCSIDINDIAFEDDMEDDIVVHKIGALFPCFIESIMWKMIMWLSGIDNCAFVVHGRQAENLHLNQGGTENLSPKSTYVGIKGNLKKEDEINY